MEANLARADDRIVEINVAYWHFSDMAASVGDVRSLGGYNGSRGLLTHRGHQDFATKQPEASPY